MGCEAVIVILAGVTDNLYPSCGNPSCVLNVMAGIPSCSLSVRSNEIPAVIASRLIRLSAIDCTSGEQPVVMTFTFLFNANVGIINILAVKLGMITESVSWLGNVGSAFWCVVLVAIWKGIPFQMIFILAALQGISGDVYESAEIDGASRWQCFWKITLPIIKEPLAISTILNLIGIVSCFNTIWLMTKGGPLYSTEIIYTYAYRRAFIDHNFGTAAAASVVLFIFMAVFSGVYLKMVSEKE